jgi:hypothetical protein
MADADPAPPENLARFTQKLGRLTEITRVIDMNRLDGVLGGSKDSSVEYVFDTNIFQMFLQPYSFSRYLELFNTPLWGMGRA